MKFSPKQIMSVTGHRSVNTLALYSKVSENEKLKMGMSMNCFLMLSNDINDEKEIHEQAEKIQKRKTQPPKLAPKTAALPALEGPPAKKPKFTEKRAKVLHPVSAQNQDPEPLTEIANFDIANPSLLPLEPNSDTDDDLFGNAEVLQVLDTIEQENMMVTLPNS